MVVAVKKTLRIGKDRLDLAKDTPYAKSLILALYNQ